jgi:hypothetical protein
MSGHASNGMDNQAMNRLNTKFVMQQMNQIQSFSLSLEYRVLVFHSNTEL